MDAAVPAAGSPHCVQALSLAPLPWLLFPAVVTY